MSTTRISQPIVPPPKPATARPNPEDFDGEGKPIDPEKSGTWDVRLYSDGIYRASNFRPFRP